MLQTTTSWDGTPLAWPAGQAELTAIEVTIVPGGETGWHEHPVPSFGVLLSGELEITLRSGAVHRVRAGDALAEVVATLHNGRVVGPDPARLVVFYAGAVGVPLTVKWK
jgi:quercetin dioxygenase-like cupin family protein